VSVTRRVGGWRFGCGSGYGIEQTTFAWLLWRAVRAEFDILHVKDPIVARTLERLHDRGWSRPRVILGNGTDETDTELRKVRYLQHLAPHYQQAYEGVKAAGQLTFAVPNFVDTAFFLPGDRAAARALWNLPADAIVVLSVSALTQRHKRCDYVIREFAAFREVCRTPAYLVLAGSREHDTAEIIELGQALLGSWLRIYESLDRVKLRSLYQAADMFGLGSLHEMLSNAVLEALACGLPVACHDAPVLSWSTGPGGAPEDLSQPGGLVRQWSRLLDPQVRADHAAAGRRHAEQIFSADVVVHQMLDMYATVLADPEPQPARRVSWLSRMSSSTR
jgi:glycosyltransferase involved in cell wall biosynthesis